MFADFVYIYIMEQSYTYHPKETVISTIDEIVDFLLTDPRTEKMKFSGKAVRLLFNYKEDPTIDDLYIGSQSLSPTNGDIMGGDFTGDETDLRNYIVNSIPIIFAKFGGKEFVLMNIVVWPGNSGHPEDFHMAFKSSDYANQIKKQLRKSEEAIDRYNI
jgi:hypothetical protein